MFEDAVNALRHLEEVAMPALEIAAAVADTQEVDDDVMDAMWKIRVIIQRVALTLRDRGMI